MTTPNTAQAHTAEPWAAFNSYSATIPDAAPDQIRDNNGAVVAWVAASGDRQEANAARIVACVNACARIPDPADALRACREALESIVKALGYAEWGSDAHAEEILSQIVRDHYVPLKAALAAITPKGAR